jgi:nitric oxide dioxygenase
VQTANGGVKMTQRWKDLRKLIEYSKSGILSKEIVKTDRHNITLFCMAKGTEISEHTSTKEGSVYVIEGKGVFNLKGESILMSPGVFIFMQKSASHSIRAEENTSFILALLS